MDSLAGYRPSATILTRTKLEEIEMELSEAVKSKLAEAVQLWADENLPGRPAILGYAVYSSVEGELRKKQKEIEETFPR
jgi:hypothetical protein